MSNIVDEKLYDRLGEDWRHINNIMWGIPSAAIAIITGVVVAAFHVEGYPRIATLGLGSIFLFAITVEIIKKRLLMNAISSKLYRMENNPFPFDTGGLEGVVKEYLNNRNDNRGDHPEFKNPDEHDPVYNLFKFSYARQYLGHVVFAAGIATSILTYWQFIEFMNYKSWSYFVGIIPVIVISVAFALVWIRNSQKAKRVNKKNEQDKDKPQDKNNV